MNMLDPDWTEDRGYSHAYALLAALQPKTKGKPMSHDEIERRNEANQGVHPYAGDRRDETGRYAVRVVYLDGVDRTESRHVSLRWALYRADEHRAELHTKGYDRHRVHVGVIDEDDPERGELDWDVVA